jgi:predicted DNA-binding protein
MLAATTTVRVSPETREALTKLSGERGVSTADLIAELVTFEQERVLLEAMRRSFAEMASDSAALAEYKAELKLWDATVGDGLQ